MTKIPRNPMRFFWWFRRLLMLVVKMKIAPKDLSELGIDPDKPVCYILHNRSLSDLLVTETACRKMGLSLPHHRPTALKFKGSAAYICLQKLGLFQASRQSGKRPPSPLRSLIAQAEADKGSEVQLVPVSVIWGRNPGRTEGSLFKLIFFDDEHAGVLQKFFIVLAQSRDCFVQFGKPISLREQINEGMGAEQTARKIRRVLRVHFRSQRLALLGPSLPNRPQVAAAVLNGKSVRRAIDEESRKQKVSSAKIEEKARRYVYEISAVSSYPIVRVFEIVLGWVWHKIFDGIDTRNLERARELSKTHEIVYLPAHRSHMDYCLLSYMLFNNGLYPPHTAAGINLNIWLVGPILRRAGAFYLRRSFKGNRLYTAVFREYVNFLTLRGYSLQFYLEGGRSRTGRLLAPKTGMLSMIVGSYLENPIRPIAFVPVYLGYDKVLEVGSYRKELAGKKKKSESLGQILKLPSILRKNIGKAYVSFGEPIRLGEFLDELRPGWRQEDFSSEQKPSWLTQGVIELARETMRRINSTAVASPVSVFALVILSSPGHAMAEQDLLYLIDKLMKSMRASPYDPDVVLPDLSPQEIVEQASRLADVRRFQHGGGDVIHLGEYDAVLLNYYRNNILHLIALPALVASFLQHNDRIAEKSIVTGCLELYPFLAAEFFLRWPIEEAEAGIREVVNALIEQGFLQRKGKDICRPDINDRDFSALHILGRSMGQTFERYSISTALLGVLSREGKIQRDEFAEQCKQMAQRIAILGGQHADFVDINMFQAFIEQLKSLYYVREDNDGLLEVDDRLKRMSMKSLELLSADIRQSILRLTKGPQPSHQGSQANG